MNTPMPKAGLQWIQQGFQTFKKHPFELLFMFFGLIFFNLGLSLIPYLGSFLPFIFGPVLGMGIMHACRDIDQAKPIATGSLLIVFRSPALKPLLVLGCLYTMALVGSLACSIPVDDGALWNYLTDPSKADQKALVKSNIGWGMLTFFAVYTPAAMGFWFGAPLIMWHGMGVAKAIFYSFFAVWRARRAFMVYLLAWCGILSFVALLVALSGGVLGVLMLPVMLMISLVMYCTFYFSYTAVFSRDQLV